MQRLAGGNMKKSMASLVLAAVAAQIQAAQAPSIDRLADCAAIGGSQERLACFDREVAPFARVRSPASTAAPTAPAAALAAKVAPPGPAPSLPAASAGT